jgi:polar amino acid transport system substrate-binding protein
MRHIILPQALRNMLPAFGNEFVTLIKESSLLSTLAIAELTMVGQQVRSVTYASFETFIIVGAIYLVMTSLTSMGLRYIEKKWSVVGRENKTEVYCMSKRFVIFMLVLAFMVSASSAIAASVADKSVVIVGTEGTWPPYEYYDDNNELVGFDIEMVKAIGVKMGKEIKVVDMAFDGLIPALLTGKIDMIAAGMHSTAERKKKIDFSDVYSIADSAFIVKNNDDRFGSIRDLPGKNVAVQLGTTEDFYVDNLKDPNINIKRYIKTVDAIRDLILDRVDTVLIGTVVAKTYVESGRYAGVLKIAFREEVDKPDEGFAMALKKNDPQFLEAVNSALKALQDSGELQALKVKYGLD